MRNLLRGHLVGNGKKQAVTLNCRNHGETKPSIAGGGLDDGVAGPQLAGPFGSIDHGKGHSILDGATRVLVFELQKNTAGTCVEPGEFEHGRVTD